MKRWQKGILAFLILVTLLTLWLLDAFTVANAHRLWRATFILLTALALPGPLVAAAHAASRHRNRWFRYGVAGLLSAVLYPLLNLTLFLTGMAGGATYRFIPSETVFLTGTPPETTPTGSGLTFLFILPTVIRILPVLTPLIVRRRALDRTDQRRLLTIAAVPVLIAVFWLLTLLLTLAGLCVPVCGFPQ